MLTHALVKMFPPGTDESYVDKILVDQAKASKGEHRGHNAYVYHREALGGLSGWVVVVVYDDRGKTIELGRGTKTIYSKEITDGDIIRF